MRITLILSLIMAFFVFPAGTSQAETMDRIVAKVNGDIILYSELQDYIRILAKNIPELSATEPDAKVKVERDVLQKMIRERLAEQEAKRLKITVSKNDVDEALIEIKQTNRMNDEQLKLMIQQSGQTPERFREEIKKELQRNRLVERVLKSKTLISKEQVDAYLKTASVDLSEGKDRRRLAIILLPIPEGAGSKQIEEVDKLSKEILAKLKGGADFGRLAVEYSKGPAVSDGGDIGFIAPDELAPPLESATRNLKPNEVSEVVKAPGGYYILKVLDVSKETVTPDASALREKARRLLYQKELNRKFEDWVKELEARSFVQISL